MAIRQKCLKYKLRRNRDESVIISSLGDSLGVVVRKNHYKNQGSPDP